MADSVEICIDVLAGGDLVEQINIALRKISEDVDERPLIQKPREVIVKISITPEYDSGENYPDVKWTVATNVPARRGARDRGIMRNGKLIINPIDRENPNQMELGNVTKLPTQKEG